MRVDFHVHTTVSDGYFSPARVLELAERAGLKLLAITDHDTAGGFDEAASLLEARRRAAEDGSVPAPAIDLVCGVEFSTAFRDDELHILGYFPGGLAPALRQFLRDAEGNRRTRIEEAVAALTRHGFPIAFSDVERLSPGRSLGRSHLARALVESGIATTFGDAFRRFLATGHGVVPPSANRAEDVVALIAAEGGISVLAHPRADRAGEQARALRPFGLDGIELYGKKRRGPDQEHLEALARELGLVATAGTDWHGAAGQPELEGVSIGVDRIGAFLGRLGIRGLAA